MLRFHNVRILKAFIATGGPAKYDNVLAQPVAMCERRRPLRTRSPMSGSSEAVGSSSSSTSGPFSTALASDTRVRCPADSPPHGRPSCAPGSNSSAGAATRGRLGGATKVGEHAQVLAHLEPLGQVDVGRGEIHPRQRREPVAPYVDPEHAAVARGGLEHAGQYRERHRLAGAVAADQHRGLARRAPRRRCRNTATAP